MEGRECSGLWRNEKFIDSLFCSESAKGTVCDREEPLIDMHGSTSFIHHPANSLTNVFRKIRIGVPLVKCTKQPANRSSLSMLPVSMLDVLYMRTI